MRVRPSLVVASLASVAACSSGPEISDTWFEELAPADAEIVAQDFPGAADLIQGFDEAMGRHRFERGDRALFGLELDENGEIERWLMTFEVLEPMALDDDGDPRMSIRTFTITPENLPPHERVVLSRVAIVRVARYRGDGEPLGTTVVQVPRDGLCRGVADACEHFQAWDREQPTDPVPEDFETFSEAMASMLAVFDIVQTDELLADVLWRVVERPSIWSMISHGGVAVGLQIHLDSAEPIEVDTPHGETVYRFPLTVTANDAPALLVFADVTAPTSPLNVGGGTLALHGSRPGDDSTRFTMRLLAARRGPD